MVIVLCIVIGSRSLKFRVEASFQKPGLARTISSARGPNVIELHQFQSKYFRATSFQESYTLQD
jgi:hypothetical protein